MPVETEMFDIDSDPINSDWLRTRRWDIHYEDALVRTLDQLRAAFDEDDDRLAHFMELPAAKAMPPDLRKAVEEYLFRGSIVKIAVYRGNDLERLAALEHAQWSSWSRSLAERGDVPTELAERWRELWVPYEELSEEEKEKDRDWARRALSVVRKSDEATGAAWAARERIERAVADFDESKHPRVPEGQGGGGQFTSGQGGGGASPTVSAPGAPRPEPSAPTAPPTGAKPDGYGGYIVPGGDYELPPHETPPAKFEPAPDDSIARASAAKMRVRAMAVEPDVSKNVREVARLTGGAMYGAQNRVKGEDSLARKLYGYVQDDGMTADQAEARVGDALRYSVILPEDRYADSVGRAIGKMYEAGYKIDDSRGRNYWTGRGLPANYKGVNINFRTPAGQIFEMQFHTPESIRTKDLLSHPIYEQVRTGLAPDGRRLTPPELKTLSQRGRSFWAKVGTPAGVLAIPGLVRG